jgi:hypothetical protein
VVDGKVQYRVNEEHPLLKVLLKDLSAEQAECLQACLELLNSTFPYDMYSADAANDKTEFEQSEPSEYTISSVGVQLVRALRSCGFEGQELRQQLENAEFYKCPPEVIEEILKIAGGING